MPERDRQKYRDYARKVSSERKQNGLCVMCGERPGDGSNELSFRKDVLKEE